MAISAISDLFEDMLAIISSLFWFAFFFGRPNYKHVFTESAPRPIQFIGCNVLGTKLYVVCCCALYDFFVLRKNFLFYFLGQNYRLQKESLHKSTERNMVSELVMLVTLILGYLQTILLCA